jgi:hypothetical protein
MEILWTLTRWVLNPMHLCSGSFLFDFLFQMLGCGGIVKSSDPEKFVILIAKSADSLLGKLFQKRIFSRISAPFFRFRTHSHSVARGSRSC